MKQELLLRLTAQDIQKLLPPGCKITDIMEPPPQASRRMIGADPYLAQIPMLLVRVEHIYAPITTPGAVLIIDDLAQFADHAIRSYENDAVLASRARRLCQDAVHGTPVDIREVFAT